MTPAVPRIAPLPPEQWTEQARAMLSGRLQRADQYLNGAADAPPLPNVLGVLGRHAELGGAWLEYNAQLLDRAELDPKLRELAVLRVAWRARSEYEWRQHTRIAKGLGVSDAQIEEITCADQSNWPDNERLVVVATDELLDRHRVTDATWAALTGQLNTRELLELLFIVGSYLCLALVFNSVDLQPDPEAEVATTPGTQVPRTSEAEE